MMDNPGITPQERACLGSLASQMGYDGIPGLLARMAELLSPHLGGNVGRPKLSDDEKLSRRADRQVATKAREAEGAFQFKDDRMNVALGEIAPAQRTYDQYVAYGQANGLAIMGKYTFLGWLSDQGFNSFPMASGKKTKPYRNGFSVRPDPAIDPEPDQAIEISEPDPNYVKPCDAARAVALDSKLVYDMVRVGAIRTIPGSGKRPMVYLPDVRAKADEFRPAPYQFPIMGDYELWLAERTTPVPGHRMFHCEAYPDYRIWCGKRGHEPLNEGKFKDAVGKKHFRACVKGNQKMTYFGVRLNEAGVTGDELRGAI